MAARAPTNEDIMQAFGRLEEKVDHVISLAEKTNGRVTTLEKWQIEVHTTEKLKKEQLPIVQRADTVVFERKLLENEKVIAAVVAVLLAIASAISYWAGGRA